jgi:hypothetical protein
MSVTERYTGPVSPSDPPGGRSGTAALKRWLWLGILAGVCADLTYMLATRMAISAPVNRMLFNFFGLFLILAAAALYRLLSHRRETMTGQLGALLVILSGLAHTVMATMQASTATRMEALLAASSDADRDMYRAIYRSVFSTQLGVDFAFDIFISVGVVLLALAMWRHPDFGRMVALFGILVATTGLALNVIAFPENAGGYGFVDPGPFFGLWFTVVTVLMAVRLYKLSRDAREANPIPGAP